MDADDDQKSESIFQTGFSNPSKRPKRISKDKVMTKIYNLMKESVELYTPNGSLKALISSKKGCVAGKTKVDTRESDEAQHMSTGAA